MGTDPSSLSGGDVLGPLISLWGRKYSSSVYGSDVSTAPRLSTQIVLELFLGNLDSQVGEESRQAHQASLELEASWSCDPVTHARGAEQAMPPGPTLDSRD